MEIGRCYASRMETNFDGLLLVVQYAYGKFARRLIPLREALFLEWNAAEVEKPRHPPPAPGRRARLR